MNKKHLIKILKTEIGILTDLINEIPDSGEIHPIEIDLTLSKTKDIYNELLLLKGNEISNAVALKEEAPAKPENEEKPDTRPEPVQEEEKVEEEKTEQENTDFEAEKPPAKKADSTSEQNQGLKIKSTKSTLKPKKDLPVNKAVVSKEESNKPEEQPAKQPEKQPDNKQTQTSEELSSENESSVVETPENAGSQKTESEPEVDVEKTTSEKEQKAKPEKSTEQIIADKFQNHSPSVNEMLASFKKDKDLATRLKDSPISDLKRAIKINDRIWFINELFNKDARLYDETLSQLNSAANLDEALKLVFNNFNWDQNKKSTISFLELLYRRFAV